MPDIAVRELKAKLSKILHVVREEKASYIVRSHGKAVAVVAPYAAESAPPIASAEQPEAAWHEIWATAALVTKGWKAKKSSATVLREMRR